MAQIGPVSDLRNNFADISRVSFFRACLGTTAQKYCLPSSKKSPCSFVCLHTHSQKWRLAFVFWVIEI
jgi:hypothetical protein